jgi:ketosteroid isomerase-like protein
MRRSSCFPYNKILSEKEDAAVNKDYRQDNTRTMEETKLSTREVIQSYYAGIGKKSGWQSAIADDIRFSGTGMQSMRGSKAFIDANSRFLQGIKASRVKMTIIEGDKAGAVVQYDMQSPGGQSMSVDVAEILTVKNGKIDSVQIFYDTAAFNDFMAKG